MALFRAYARFAPSQLETSLQSNTVSHWLGTNLESALLYYDTTWCALDNKQSIFFRRNLFIVHIFCIYGIMENDDTCFY